MVFFETESSKSRFNKIVCQAINRTFICSLSDRYPALSPAQRTSMPSQITIDGSAGEPDLGIGGVDSNVYRVESGLSAGHLKPHNKY